MDHGYLWTIWIPGTQVNAHLSNVYCINNSSTGLHCILWPIVHNKFACSNSAYQTATHVKHRCCIFWPTLGCCTLQRLIEMSMSNAKNWKRKKKQKIEATFSPGVLSLHPDNGRGIKFLQPFTRDKSFVGRNFVSVNNQKWLWNWKLCHYWSTLKSTLFFRE